jgi:hypothetical protein
LFGNNREFFILKFNKHKGYIMAANNKNIERLSELLIKVSNKLNREIPIILEIYKLKPRQTRKKSLFGIEVELLVALARLFNRPLSPEEPWTQSKELDYIQDALEVLSIPEKLETEFLDCLEGVRESYGYHSFVMLDENGIPNEIIDASKPDAEELAHCANEVLKVLKLRKLDTPLQFDENKWLKAESKAHEKAEAQLATRIEALKELAKFKI